MYQEAVGIRIFLFDLRSWCLLIGADSQFTLSWIFQSNPCSVDYSWNAAKRTENFTLKCWGLLPVAGVPRGWTGPPHANTNSPLHQVTQHGTFLWCWQVGNCTRIQSFPPLRHCPLLPSSSSFQSIFSPSKGRTTNNKLSALFHWLLLPKRRNICYSPLARNFLPHFGI
jgi:hypothetical protein